MKLGWEAVNTCSLLQKAASADCDRDLKIIKDRLAEALIHTKAAGEFRLQGRSRRYTLAIGHSSYERGKFRFKTQKRDVPAFHPIATQHITNHLIAMTEAHVHERKTFAGPQD